MGRKIVLAPDSYKGSLTARQACDAMEVGIRRVWSDADVVKVPMADGGEGTVQSLVDATGGELIEVEVTGPLREPVRAVYGILGEGNGKTEENEQHDIEEANALEGTNVSEGANALKGVKRSDHVNGSGNSDLSKTAIIEMASASGLLLVPPDRRNPLLTTTYGTGELIRHALDQGCRRFLIGLGGSATNDGGAGMAQALGAKFLDAKGEELAPGGGALGRLARVDVSELDPRLQDCTFTVACDVDNPLLGPQGASHIFGPQKGATPAQVLELDRNLAQYADIVERDLHISVRDLPGAGAAGGLGAGVVAFLGATLRKGVELVIEATRLRNHLANADLVLSGEGQCDAQTLYGKTPFGVAQVAKQAGVPVVLIAGSVGHGVEALYPHGVTSVFSLVDRPMTVEEAMTHAPELLANATERIIRLWG